MCIYVYCLFSLNKIPYSLLISIFLKKHFLTLLKHKESGIIPLGLIDNSNNGWRLLASLLSLVTVDFIRNTSRSRIGAGVLFACESCPDDKVVHVAKKTFSVSCAINSWTKKNAHYSNKVRCSIDCQIV